mmetsp:Transcript_14855/g.23428  ORF Transcript_14855/g.23428 Transcript_14855/m.23428 type:complete len:478 (+) Transcript_14855:815-2248(+)
MEKFLREVEKSGARKIIPIRFKVKANDQALYDKFCHKLGAKDKPRVALCNIIREQTELYMIAPRLAKRFRCLRPYPEAHRHVFGLLVMKPLHIPPARKPPAAAAGGRRFSPDPQDQDPSAEDEEYEPYGPDELPPPAAAAAARAAKPRTGPTQPPAQAAPAPAPPPGRDPDPGPPPPPRVPTDGELARAGIDPLEFQQTLEFAASSGPRAIDMARGHSRTNFEFLRAGGDQFPTFLGALKRTLLDANQDSLPAQWHVFFQENKQYMVNKPPVTMHVGQTSQQPSAPSPQSAQALPPPAQPSMPTPPPSQGTPQQYQPQQLQQPPAQQNMMSPPQLRNQMQQQQQPVQTFPQPQQQQPQQLPTQYQQQGPSFGVFPNQNLANQHQAPGGLPFQPPSHQQQQLQFPPQGSVPLPGNIHQNPSFQQQQHPLMQQPFQQSGSPLQHQQYGGPPHQHHLQYGRPPPPQSGFQQQQHPSMMRR